MEENLEIDKRVEILLRLPANAMYKAIQANVKNNVPEHYGDEFAARINPWDDIKDNMLRNMSIYEVAYRLRYPLKWVKKRARYLGIGHAKKMRDSD